MPMEWPLRPVSKQARDAEQTAVVWKLVKRRSAWRRPLPGGVGHTHRRAGVVGAEGFRRRRGRPRGRPRAAPPLRSGHRLRRPSPRLCRLEELDRVAGGVVEQDLLTPGPAMMSLRKLTPAARSRCTSAAMSSTTKWMRFQPPGSGWRPSGIGRPAELVGPASSNRSLPRRTSANAGEALCPSSNPNWRM